jgi:hypothetical protein
LPGAHDECVLSTTTTTPSTPGRSISRDEFFAMLKNEREDRFSKLIIPSAEPVLSAEDWLKSIRKWGSSLERDEMHELIIDLQEGQETDCEVIVKTLRYYKLNLPFAKTVCLTYDSKYYYKCIIHLFTPSPLTCISACNIFHPFVVFLDSTNIYNIFNDQNSVNSLYLKIGDKEYNYQDLLKYRTHTDAFNVNFANNGIFGIVQGGSY